MTGALNNKYQFFFDGWFTSVEKLLSAHRYSYSVLTRRKIINKVFTIFLACVPCILLPERYITL